MRSIIYFLLVAVILPHSIAAQRNNVWYFGGQAGLDFNAPGGPTPLADGKLTANEACSSICDGEGNILFYTDGVKVYNRNHELMVNGDFIGGNTSSFQGALIIPHPGNENLYYIFSGDALENDYEAGYRYSIIDMRGDNGNGTVVSKNLLLASSGTERLAATRHANGVDVWVVTNDMNSNVFRAWLINCEGLQTVPVTSTVGEVMNQHEVVNVGALRFSPNGKLLVQTHFPDILASGSTPPDFFQLFDFNNLTGTISNPRKFEFSSSVFVNAEFSADSRYLYLVKGGMPGIDQFDVSLPTMAEMISSRQTISSPPRIYAIQLGPDKKIYLAPSGRTVGVINNPEKAYPACDYHPDFLEMDRAVTLAFPAAVNDLSADPYNYFDADIIDSCLGMVQFSGHTVLSGTIGWAWDFGDGTTSNLQNPVHTFDPPNQNYLVKLVITSISGCGKIARTMNIFPGGVNAKIAFSSFGGCDSGYIRFENTSVPQNIPNAQYIWDFGDGTTSTELHPTHFYSAAGMYNVKLKLKASKSCLDDSVSATVDMASFQGSLIMSPDRTIFSGQTITLNAIGPGGIYAWTPATALTDPSIPNPKASPVDDITYKVRVSNPIGCYLEGDVNIKVVEPRDIYVPSGFTPNNDGKNDLLRPIYGSKHTLEEFSVYNRWGEKVFSTSERWAGWDGTISGTAQSTGVYVWTLRIKDENGDMVERKGSSVLIR